MGYVMIDYVDYSKLKLTPLSRSLLYDKKPISLAKFVWQEKAKSKKKEPVQAVTDYDIDLFRSLKELRKKIASERGVPAFVIFGDASLREMAHYKPKTLTDFSQIKGVGTFKLEEFGEAFITSINEYVDE
jgi:ATP-dependent DNA helicase RecQ